MDPFKQLWAEAAEEVRLKQYSFMDEGPTVLVMLDLNEHLPIGNDASAAVATFDNYLLIYYFLLLFRICNSDALVASRMGRGNVS